MTLQRACLFSMTAVLAGNGCRCGQGPAASAPQQRTDKAVAAEAGPVVPAPPAPPAPVPAGKGAITGVVSFSGRPPEPREIDRSSDPFCARTPALDESIVVNPNGTLKDVIVRVTDVATPAEPPAEPALMDQKECIYVPRVQGLVAGRKIAIRNSDQTLHNVHVYRGSVTLFNVAQPAGGLTVVKKLREGDPDIVTFKCDVHPWMTAHVLVSPHPHFAVTAGDGRFTLPDVPAGRHVVEAWHEVLGTRTAEVEVTADGTTEVAIGYDGTGSPRPRVRPRE